MHGDAQHTFANRDCRFLQVLKCGSMLLLAKKDPSKNVHISKSDIFGMQNLFFAAFRCGRSVLYLGKFL